MDFVRKDSIEQLLEQKRIERDSLFSTCTLIDGKIYSFTSFKRIPIMVDLHAKEMVLLKDLKDYDASFVADAILSAGDTIFVLELNGNRLMTYNINDRKCNYIPIDCGKKGWGNYAAFVQYKKEIYIFPIYEEAIIKINIETGKVQRDKGLYSKLCKCKTDIGQEQEETYFYCGCQCENIMWLFQRQGNLAVAYDMRNDTWKEYRLSVYIDNCVHVVQYGGRIYILSSEGKIYCWDMTDAPVNKIADCSDIETDSNTFLRIAITDKKIFLLPSLGSDIYVIDSDTKKVSRYEDYPVTFRYCEPKSWSKYYGYCEDNDRYYFAMRSMNFMFSLDKREENVEWIKLKLPFYEEFVKEYIKGNRNMLGETEVTLEALFTYTSSNYKENLIQKNISIGKQIWKQVNVD